MKIKTTRNRMFYSGTYHKIFDISVITDSARIETTLEDKEACERAISFLEDTLLDECWEEDVMVKLLEAGIINHDMIRKYAEEWEWELR